MQYLIFLLFIPLLIKSVEIYTGMNLMPQTAFQNQNQNQNQNCVPFLKTDTFCERWSYNEKLFPTNCVQPQSIGTSSFKFCKEGSSYYQKDILKDAAFA